MQNSVWHIVVLREYLLNESISEHVSLVCLSSLSLKFWTIYSQVFPLSLCLFLSVSISKIWIGDSTMMRIHHSGMYVYTVIMLAQ